MGLSNAHALVPNRLAYHIQRSYLINLRLCSVLELSVWSRPYSLSDVPD